MHKWIAGETCRFNMVVKYIAFINGETCRFNMVLKYIAFINQCI
jgi:hypothetical protein